jgi:hypothetical protein
MKVLKSLGHHALVNIAVTVIVIACGHLIFYVLA